jgi:hypothetical protein
MRRSINVKFFAVLAVLAFAGVATGQQPAVRAPQPIAEPGRIAAPATPVTLAATLGAVRNYACRPSPQASGAAEGRADCAPGEGWSCPVQIEFRRTADARPETCPVQCTLASTGAQCNCTINTSACTTQR